MVDGGVHALPRRGRRDVCPVVTSRRATERLLFETHIVTDEVGEEWTGFVGRRVSDKHIVLRVLMCGEKKLLARREEG